MDIKACKRIVKKGGLIVMHDTNLVSVQKGISKSKIAIYSFNIGTGIGFGWND
jgi:7-keto-8-aminopelargonate synthetase-like enzyme